MKPQSGVVGILGGSGLTELDSLTIQRRERVDTPFGRPSGPLLFGELEGDPVVFLSRHGPNHELLPGEVPVRANMYAFKQAGVNRVLGISAVGSLRNPIEPGSLIVPEQLIDHTRDRNTTFFGDGLVGHVAFGEPFCPDMLDVFWSRKSDPEVAVTGTYVNMEGPQFSTRAESERYRGEGGDIIGMTVAPEAKLAREAELCYGLLAMVTDYDAWKGEEATAETEQILETLAETREAVHEVLESQIHELQVETRSCPCATAQDGALITPPEAVPERTRRRLASLLRVDGYEPVSGLSRSDG